MSVTLVCPSCNIRWKIFSSSEKLDRAVKCPNCSNKYDPKSKEQNDQKDNHV